MKLTFVQLLLAGVFTLSSYARESKAQGVLDKPISLTMENTEVKKVLARIRQQADVEFVYSSTVVQVNEKISVDARQKKLGEVLSEMLQPLQIAYRVIDEQIVLYPTPVPPAPTTTAAAGVAEEKAERSVRGKVTDAAGEPLSGVSVMIKGTRNGTTTDATGNYSLNLPEGSVVLVFSSVGFDPQEVTVGEKTVINISLVATVRQLDQVVVVGYGTQRRSQITGSVARISGTEITKQPVLTAAQGLQGKASGIQVIASGAPGSQPQVRIRGINTVSGDANPVYVVDGVITDNISNINTSDIASVEVLKDASSQAIYGSRGANGVILITTNSGRTGKAKVRFESYVGYRAVTSKVEMADARTYAQYSNEALAYDNKPALFNPDTLKYNTDWFDEITRNGMVQNYNVNLSGGTDRTTYYFSAGYFKDEGIHKGSDYERILLRNNNDYRPADFVKLGHSLNLSVVKQNNGPVLFNNAYLNAPTTPVRFANGNYGYLKDLNVGNPVAAIDINNSISNRVRLLGNLFGELTPLKGLTLRSSFNFDRYDNNSRAYTPKFEVSQNQRSDSSSLTVGMGRGFSWILENTASYKKLIAARHEVNAMAGYTAERNNGAAMSGSGNNVPAESNLWYLDLSTTGPTRTVSNYGWLSTRASYFGRLTYTYDNKYNVNGVIRRDGSSNFPPEQKWGTFYSAGASWVVSREAFMQGQRVFDELKLRVGYGKLGSDRGLSQPALYPVTSIPAAYNFGGEAGGVVPGVTFNQVTDARISWENTKGVDAGAEFALLNRKLSGEVTYYNKLSNAYIPVTIGATFGDQSGQVISQAADIRNRGVEVNLRWNDNVSKDFNYHIGGNITFNRNEVEKVKGLLQLKGGSLGNGEIVTYTVEGQPVGSFWVFNALGIIRDSATYNSVPKITGTKLGDFYYEDLNKDNKIDDKDRVFVGSYQPKMYYGINAGLNWKQLDFSIDCYGNAGNKVYNGKKSVRLGNENIEADRADDRWSASNPNGSQPRASNAIPKPSSYYVESGDFFRINNVTLGYNIPADKWRVGISGFRVFASAQNPVIFKKYSGYTPELSGGVLDAGIELGIYPISSTYLLGVNLSF